MKIRLRRAERAEQGQSGAGTTDVVTASVLSGRDFDAVSDVEPRSLRLAGHPVRTKSDAAGKDRPDCEARDVNDDKVDDLACEVEIERGALKSGKKLRLEAMTHHGWGIAGAGVLREGSSRHRD